ncbi:MAG: elongation factor Ts [Bacteroidales bacterium]|nr:elongation factor Ts [Bacteroidota bacterium]MBL6949572.1 elongation factor Ts [Bacteroidales bacterium]
MNITAKDVSKLRQRTGAGMMDCKKALQESKGDFDQAVDYLRKKGQKVASKRADRDANEGIAIARTNTDKNFGAVVMVSCETDFVGKNEEFIQFANDLLDLGIDNQLTETAQLKPMKVGDLTVEEKLNELLGKTGEKMQIASFQSIAAPAVFVYNHHGNRLATIVGFNKKDVEGIDELGREVAMQVAAMNPVAIDKEDVDKAIVDHEIEIGKEQARQAGKPEDLLEKIAMGKLNKFYKESTLVNQEFIKDNKKSVGQYISEYDKELKVVAFKRLELGV